MEDSVKWREMGENRSRIPEETDQRFGRHNQETDMSLLKALGWWSQVTEKIGTF